MAEVGSSMARHGDSSAVGGWDTAARVRSNVAGAMTFRGGMRRVDACHCTDTGTDLHDAGPAMLAFRSGRRRIRAEGRPLSIALLRTQVAR
jgi:hypothetical protein